MSIPLAHSHRGWAIHCRTEWNPLCFPSSRETLDLGVHFALGVRSPYKLFKNHNMAEFSIISLSVCFKPVNVQGQAVELWGTEGRLKGRAGERAE